MAAFAALRRAWIAAGALHPQVPRTSTPLRWSQVKSRLASPQQSQNCHVVLFRPAIRHQSTAAAAGAQVAQAAAPAPVETVLPLEELSQVAEESTLAELGLGGFSPVGLIMKILESFHLDLGLPWWGAIVGGTVLARCLVFPLIVKSQRQAVLLNNHYPQMSEMNSRITDARKSGNRKEFMKAYTELNQYQKQHNLNPRAGFLAPLIQTPIFISFFFALRKMAECPVPSMQTGGLWWFTDLTAPDPYYALPLITTATMWAVLEFGAETGVSNPSYHVMKTVFRVMPLLLLPITINFPTAIFSYWLTSNLYSLGQVLLLRSPSVRTFLRMPKPEIHKPAAGQAPKGLFDSFKTGWESFQAKRRLQEREDRIKNHLTLAAAGPLRQTFTENPLKDLQLESSKTTTTTKKRPWEDTLI
ncbi:mitochondrial inner membrane protein OXA1L [Protobothrops mucrosquamatus]|uniref:mitochondrial inner membrane protein OXA1L n=1 Tax=Protobothrops mucrosquamatus TaxID=103944 RepID=UPI000775ECA3|nr:mitochondrial inner membrane protein OXA1L [Protobothrops mucrosquamatus]